MKTFVLLSLTWFGLWPLVARAQAADDGGEVRLPLKMFSDLAAKAGDPKKPVVAPATSYALAQAEVEVTLPEASGSPAKVDVTLTVHVLTDEWTSVPLLPVGTSLSRALLDEAPIALSALRGDLVWSTNARGTHVLKLSYAAAVRASLGGQSLVLPIPAASAISFTARIPGSGLDVAVIPSAGFETSEEDGRTVVRAAVPTASGIQVSWRVPAERKVIITSARYDGAQKGKVVAWRAQFTLRSQSFESVTVPILGRGVAVADARLDGKPAVVLEEGEFLVVQVQGAGRHEVMVDFETPVSEEGGPPGTRLWLPRPPQSTFTLSLPGKKEVSVQPAAGVDLAVRGDRTVATVHLPPSDEAVFSWPGALPEAVKENLRANAEVYHFVRAEEGVLQIEAIVAYEVTRGATNRISAFLPAGVVVNRVTGDGVTEWRAEKHPRGQQLSVFLDRDLRGGYRFQVSYEILLGGGEKAPAQAIPLLQPAEVHRQRGMVALLSGTELEVRPQNESAMNKVGENQIPAWAREGISQAVAHTFKYVEPSASLSVVLAPPEKKRGKFDAVVDTLFSVGDGVLKASASVEIAIKTGKLMDLELSLPENINLIGVTAPSLREHKVSGEDGKPQTLALQFTQEMEGTLRIEVAYERGIGADVEKVLVPAIHVPGADMEQGRLAVEALSAVEVQALESDRDTRLLPLDVQELPRQLTLRTTNPVLMAYKYVHAEPPFALTLEVRRHAELKVQVASIDHASYQTLFTRHGLSLTRVSYQIRNRRKQFLAVQLPEGSELWSAELAGQPVKPAAGAKPSQILVPLVNSAVPFAVEIVYRTTVPKLGFAGWLRGSLPVPDVVEAQSSWDVFLPDDLEYGQVDTNMRVVVEAEPTSAQPDMSAAARALAGEDTGAGETPGGGGGVLPLRMDVPTHGIHFRFEKLFANQGEEDSRFSIHYSTGAAHGTGGLLLFFAVLWLGLAGLGAAGLVRKRLSRVLAALLSLGAVVVAVVSVAVLNASVAWGVAGAIVAAVLAVALKILPRLRRSSPPPVTAA
ncbi:MAG: hypothetical protein GYA21_10490 [Myxococcales bacterium]|nr:hypothetical protein [Myxococcales bacterium]